jgi:hypothetical protein
MVSIFLKASLVSVVFGYFGKLLCFVSKKCEGNPFILLMDIYFGVILVLIFV